MIKFLEYDDFIKESEWCTDSYFQPMYVRINGKEYPIKEWYPDCDQYDDPEYPNSKEECNYRIVFEI